MWWWIPGIRWGRVLQLPSRWRPFRAQPPPATGIAPRYQVYAAPPTAGGAESSGEPSIGIDWNPNVASLKHGTVNQGGVAFFTSNLHEFRVQFDDCSSPATTNWTDVSSPVETINTLDPIGACIISAEVIRDVSSSRSSPAPQALWPSPMTMATPGYNPKLWSARRRGSPDCRRGSV